MANTQVKPIPDGYHTITPYIIAKGADKLIGFIKNAFGGKELSVHKMPDGSIMHAEVQVGDSRIMISEASDRYPAAPAMLHLYVNDCDGTYKKAVQAGGVSLREPVNEFYGDRTAGIKDVSGNQWWISTHVEDVSPEEMERRSEEYAKKQAQSS